MSFDSQGYGKTGEQGFEVFVWAGVELGDYGDGRANTLVV